MTRQDPRTHAPTPAPAPPQPAPAPSPLAYSDRDLDRAGLLSRKQRWRLRREGKFPTPITVGSRKLYRAVDVHSWLADPDGWAAQQRKAG